VIDSGKMRETQYDPEKKVGCLQRIGSLHVVPFNCRWAFWLKPGWRKRTRRSAKAVQAVSRSLLALS
jgi:hypothetical protein